MADIMDGAGRFRFGRPQQNDASEALARER
jgi:hypothetical protein